MLENMLQLFFIKRKKKPSKLLQLSIKEKHGFSSLLLSLTLIPLLRILSLVLPLRYFPVVQRFLIIAIPLYIACFVLILQLKMDVRRLSLRFPEVRYLPLEVGIVALAVPCGYIEYLILRPPPLIGSFYFESLLEAILIIFISTGLVEEIIFRGILQSKSIEVFGEWPGIFFVSSLFAVLHIGHLSFLDVLLAFFMGFLYGVVVRTSRSLIGVSISHALMNVFLLIICPLTLI
jgi:hypothetical protein